MIKWLRKKHIIHNWSNWSNPYTPTGLMFSRQKRTCSVCNKVEVTTL